MNKFCKNIRTYLSTITQEVFLTENNKEKALTITQPQLLICNILNR